MRNKTTILFLGLLALAGCKIRSGTHITQEEAQSHCEAGVELNAYLTSEATTLVLACKQTTQRLECENGWVAVNNNGWYCT
jgi:uncharacterized protein YcfL